MGTEVQDSSNGKTNDMGHDARRTDWSRWKNPHLLASPHPSYLSSEAS